MADTQMPANQVCSKCKANKGLTWNLAIPDATVQVASAKILQARASVKNKNESFSPKLIYLAIKIHILISGL